MTLSVDTEEKHRQPHRVQNQLTLAQYISKVGGDIAHDKQAMATFQRCYDQLCARLAELSMEPSYHQFGAAVAALSYLDKGCKR